VKKSDAISSEHKELLVRIGKTLQKLRAERGKTYVETAKEMGVPRNTLNRMELGQINFQFLTLVRALNYYHLSISQFFDKLN
jgi:transcriptional regulator with XRE-family HTH domain